MVYVLSAASRANLVGVHPDLVRVIQRAIATTGQDFSVIEGVRSHDGMCQTWGQGRTVEECEAKGVPGSYARPELQKITWLNDPFGSRHRVMPDGYGHAVDLAPYPISWSEAPANLARFDAVAEAMKAAATDCGVQIGWGGDWVINKDRPHFELKLD